MSKVAHYLQDHLTGEVMTSSDVREYFSTDASIFESTPAIVVYPRNENDVRKTARFSWQLAERGRVVPITARGRGTDQSGAAIGSGIMLVFPAHMNKLLELDSKTGVSVVEPGINYAKLQQTLHTHGRFLPPYPASLEYCTVGGAVANNASGEKSVKYGCTRDYVKGLRVVLANGEVIETRRLSKRELNKKLGLQTFEGEVYRGIDTLIEENRDVIEKTRLNISKNSAGYSLNEVKQKNGSFDLTPLIVGSQGTLGVVTEIVLDTEAHTPETTLILAQFDDMQLAEETISELKGFPEPPSAIEFVDEHLLQFVHANNPNQLKGIIDPPYPKLVALIEFDSPSPRTQKRMTKKAIKLLKRLQINHQVETEAEKIDELWKVRHSAATVLSYNDGRKKAVPVIEDGVVPSEKFKEYVAGVYKLFDKYDLKVALWGHAGNANLHMQPFLDLSHVGDRQKAFRIIDDYYRLVISLGGSTTGEHGDGRLRAPYLRDVYGDDVYRLFQDVKKIFDPYGFMNPGVKMDVSMEDNKPMLRQEYSIKHLADHLPKT
jgi:FAD/FMN-containing dehydrogenase